MHMRLKSLKQPAISNVTQRELAHTSIQLDLDIHETQPVSICISGVSGTESRSPKSGPRDLLG